MNGYKKWRQALQLAPDAQAVNRIVRDFVDAFRPLAVVLPVECRDALEGEPDVQAAAVTLLQGELGFNGQEDVRAVLHEAAHIFASAAVRITVLHAAASISVRDLRLGPRPATDTDTNA